MFTNTDLLLHISIDCKKRCKLTVKQLGTSVHGTDFNHLIYVTHFFFFPVALRPNAGHGLLILEVSRSHTTTYHSR